MEEFTLIIVVIRRTYKHLKSNILYRIANVNSKNACSNFCCIHLFILYTIFLFAKYPNTIIDVNCYDVYFNIDTYNPNILICE